MKIGIRNTLPYILMVGGLLGLVASFALTYDKIQILKTPDYTPSCNINPIFSCGSVMSSEQATLFGIPNSIFGIAAFSALITFGVLLYFKTRYDRRVWIVAQITATLGVLYMHYLFFQGVYKINAICPWCFVVWMVTIPIFWGITVYNLKQKNVTTSTRLKALSAFLQKYSGEILFAWYVIIFLILLEHFWYYWSTLI